MSESKWTPEPWSSIPQGDGSNMIVYHHETDSQMRPKAFRIIAHCLARKSSLPMDEANADRIVACVNACVGMVDPAKEIAELRDSPSHKLKVVAVQLQIENTAMRKAIQAIDEWVVENAEALALGWGEKTIPIGAARDALATKEPTDV